MRHPATRIALLSDAAVEQSEGLLKPGQCCSLSIIARCNPPCSRFAATELDNATLSCIAQRQCTPLLRCRRIAQLCAGATTALLESFRAWNKLIGERTLAMSRSELV